MEPVNVHRSPTGISKPMLIGLVLALAIGAYLGGSIASGVNQGGMGSLFALIGGIVVGSILAVMAVVAAILAKSRDTSGHAAARSIFFVGTAFVIGVGIGWAVEPAFRPEYHELASSRLRGR